jgi:hypothetical protein
MDDDSLIENILKWNFSDTLDAGLIDEIPRTVSGKENKMAKRSTTTNSPPCNVET